MNIFLRNISIEHVLLVMCDIPGSTWPVDKCSVFISLDNSPVH